MSSIETRGIRLKNGDYYGPLDISRAKEFAQHAAFLRKKATPKVMAGSAITALSIGAGFAAEFVKPGEGVGTAVAQIGSAVGGTLLILGWNQHGEANGIRRQFPDYRQLLKHLGL